MTQLDMLRDWLVAYCKHLSVQTNQTYKLREQWFKDCHIAALYGHPQPIWKEKYGTADL